MMLINVCVGGVGGAGPRTLGYYQDFVLNAMENYVRALGWRKTWVGLPFYFFFTLFFYFLGLPFIRIILGCCGYRF